MQFEDWTDSGMVFDKAHLVLDLINYSTNINLAHQFDIASILFEKINKRIRINVYIII